jgi:cytochrome b involved in lipid metabolism
MAQQKKKKKKKKKKKPLPLATNGFVYQSSQNPGSESGGSDGFEN